MSPWLSPITLLLIGIVLVALALAARRRWLLLFAALLTLAGIALMTPVLANVLVRSVEQRAANDDHACADVEAVVLLSGGLARPPEDGDDYAALTAASLARVFGLLRQSELAPVPLLVSGGGPFAAAEADVLGNLLVRLGVDRRGLLLESQSDSTWSSAEAVRELLPEDVRRIALASEALHLSRAALVFRRVGFEVCSLPLASRWVDARGIGAWWPQSSALRKSERALYEIVGEQWYRVRIAWQQGFG